MRLILIRHGLPERDEVVSAAPDPALSEVGRRQVAAMTDELASERIDAIWSSPLRRARETADPLAAARGLDVCIHPGLAEFDFGHGVYVPAEDTAHPVVRQMTAFMAEQDGNEELQAFRSTVAASMSDVLATAQPDWTVAVACHGGVINAYTSSVLGTRDVFFANVTYAGLTTFTISRSGRVWLVALNEHAHIRALG